MADDARLAFGFIFVVAVVAAIAFNIGHDNGAISEKAVRYFSEIQCFEAVVGNDEIKRCYIIKEVGNEN